MHHTATDHETLTLLRVADELLPELFFLLEHGVGVRLEGQVSLAGFLEAYGAPEGIGMQYSVRCNGEPLAAAQACVPQPGELVEISEAGLELETDYEEMSPEERQAEEALLAYCLPLAREAGAFWLRLGEEHAAAMASGLLRSGVLAPVPLVGALLQVLPESFWLQSGGVLLHGRRFDPLTHELGLPRSNKLLLVEARAPQTDME